MSQGEYLSEDILDPDFLKCLSPIHIMQYFLGSIHADIRDGFITPTTKCQILYTLLWIAFASLSFYHLCISYITHFYDKNVFLTFSYGGGILMQYAVYLCNVYHAKFSEGRQTIQIYLMLHKIDRMLKVYTISNFNNKHYYHNYGFVLSVIFVYFNGFLIHVYFCIEKPEGAVFIGLAFMIIYLESILTGTLIYYLGSRLKFLNDLMKLNIVMKRANNIAGMDYSWTVGETFIIFPEYTDNYDKTNRNMNLNTCLLSVEMILKTFSLVTRRFQLPVFSIVMIVYFWTLLVIQTLVIGLTTGLLSLTCAITLISWIVFYYVQVTALAIATGWFSQQANGTKALCIYALSVYSEGPVYKATKDLIRLLEVEKPVFSIFGLFDITRALPITMVALITNNVVILLQFTFN